ncbi:hypothetical protein MNB_SM-4-283 [hydrothermal vent metagenome]|uniref:Uncharacterized protein n=1 Tax=hydrothermal vent metagenome TaxID=652676 RepID=A0A1W1BRJ6_9ZZZZ
MGAISCISNCLSFESSSPSTGQHIADNPDKTFGVFIVTHGDCE